MKRGCPHIHPEHGLFDGGRRGDHLFIHHGSKLLYPHVLPLRTQLLNTRSHQRCKIVVLSGLVGSRTERASPLPERGCAGRCSAPPTGLLPGDCSETSGPSVTEGGCWRSRGSCRLSLRERGSEAGGSVNRWFGTLSDDLRCASARLIRSAWSVGAECDVAAVLTSVSAARWENCVTDLSKPLASK